MTGEDINDIINAICPNDEDYEKPCISPKYLRQKLEQLALDQEQKMLEPTTKSEAKYCDRNICLKNEYNNIGCEDCEVTKSQEPTTQERQAESGKLDTAFQDGYDHGYAQARFDYEQEPRKGHWGWLRCDMYVCSECKNVYTDLSGIKDGMNYCPNCGADMREVEE